MIRTGCYVRYKEIIDEGDESTRMRVLDDYGEDSDRCLVEDLGTILTFTPTRVVLKRDLELI